MAFRVRLHSWSMANISRRAARPAASTCCCPLSTSLSPRRAQSVPPRNRRENQSAARPSNIFVLTSEHPDESVSPQSSGLNGVWLPRACRLAAVRTRGTAGRAGLHRALATLAAGEQDAGRGYRVFLVRLSALLCVRTG